ncbi:hypothetical protein [Streptomyces sp. NRRL S-87]|uniref:hypothetical protein n=1 Tax=Streptomyces sp. NRRL S-87 TaxID=1463920 RepID=UPI0004BF7CCD|nr:hypothetical protein [Streptomyces sp. NRRL S-87]
MTIMAHRSLPLNTNGIATDLHETLAEGWSLAEDVRGLARHGVEVSVTVDPTTITAVLTVDPAAVAVLPALLREIDNARLDETRAGAPVVLGSVCQGTVTIRLKIPVGLVPSQVAALLPTPAAAKEDR